MISAALLALRTGAGVLLGGIGLNWLWYAGVAAASAAAMYFMAATFHLVRENATLKATVETYAAAARAQAVANDLEEKAAVDAATAETNNARVLEGWHGTIIEAPGVADCVAGDTLSRLRKLQ
jgi:hypothetical protein